MSNRFPDAAQMAAVHVVAKDQGWDRLSGKRLGLLLWALFHYFAWRIGNG